MIGATLNAAGIVVGGAVGLMRTTPLTAQSQAFYKTALGVFTVFYGLRLTWLSINGPAGDVIRQIIIALIAIIIGRMLGRLLRFQKGSNHLGRYARQLIESTKPSDPQRFSNGMNACAILFCASPLGILGAVHDGLPVEAGGAGYFYPLAVKAVMDGLAMLGFVAMFGAGGILAALPVFVFQASITLACHLYAEPFLRAHGLLDPVNAVGGLIICTVGLVIFEIKKVELADYLPSLAVAPVITWLWANFL